MARAADIRGKSFDPTTTPGKAHRLARTQPCALDREPPLLGFPFPRDIDPGGNRQLNRIGPLCTDGDHRFRRQLQLVVYHSADNKLRAA